MSRSPTPKGDLDLGGSKGEVLLMEERPGGSERPEDAKSHE